MLVLGFERPTLLCRVSIEIHALALEHKRPVWLRRSLARPRWNNGTRINHCEMESPAPSNMSANSLPEEESCTKQHVSSGLGVKKCMVEERCYLLLPPVHTVPHA